MRELIVMVLVIALLVPAGAGQSEREKTVIFVVNSDIFPHIKGVLEELNREFAGWKFDIVPWGHESPRALRSYLQEHSEDGAVLVGNITIPYYYNPVMREYAETLYYYMDLRGVWKCSGEEVEPVRISHPDIWVSVVRSTDMNGNNLTQILGYFHRVMIYGEGGISALAEGAGYIDDDFSVLYSNISRNLELLYPARMYYYTYETTTEGFLNMLSEKYALAHIIVHSDGANFYIRENDKYRRITIREVDAAHPQILFYTDFSCHGADFNLGAITNHLVMMGAGLGALASTGIIVPRAMPRYYESLSAGSDFGEAMLGYMDSGLSEKNGFYKYVANICFLGLPLLHAYRPRGYRHVAGIVINGNSELREFTSEMHLPGRGTEDEPIILSGFYITGGGELRISNTSLFLRVERNYLSTTSYVGILLEKCRNVEVTDNVVIGSHLGIYTGNSSNIVVKRNMVRVSAGAGIFVKHSRCRVLDNEVVDSGTGIIAEALFEQGKYEYVRGMNISGNKILESKNGMYLFGLRDSYITENYVDPKCAESYSVFPHTTVGIYLYDSTDNIIIFNTIKNVTLLMIIGHSRDNRIYENNFYRDFDGTGVQFFMSSPSDCPNFWNSSFEGNYWLSWANSNNSNDLNGDGIVDYPYVIAPHNVDYHPLKYPVGECSSQNPPDEQLSVGIVLLFVAIMAALGRIERG